MNAPHPTAAKLTALAAVSVAEPRQLSLFAAAALAAPRARPLGPLDPRNPDGEAWDEAYYAREGR